MRFSPSRIVVWSTAFAGAILTAVLLAAALFSAQPAEWGGFQPRLTSNHFVTGTNAKLPVYQWLPEDKPIKAVIVAVHGFNDYGKFFFDAGNYFKQAGIVSYAYDQRGFGGAPRPGSWASVRTYLKDLFDFTRLIRERHLGIPLYLLGESMGAAEIILAMTGEPHPQADGVILSAPAVLDWTTVPWYQKAGLWLASHSVPWLRLTGESLHVVPSDNIEMLRALNHDPLVIKDTRIGTVYRLANLMTQAFERARRLDALTLILYGERDEIVPKRSVYSMLSRLPPTRRWRAAFYEHGYHLLLRDMEAPTLWRDILAWIDNPLRRLPSGGDKRAVAVLAGSQ